MKPTFYVASSLDNSEQAQALIRALHARGWAI